MTTNLFILLCLIAFFIAYLIWDKRQWRKYRDKIEEADWWDRPETTETPDKD